MDAGSSTRLRRLYSLGEAGSRSFRWAGRFTSLVPPGATRVQLVRRTELAAGSAGSLRQPRSAQPDQPEKRRAESRKKRRRHIDGAQSMLGFRAPGTAPKYVDRYPGVAFGISRSRKVLPSVIATAA
jgi:hypothetical protein